MEDRSQAKTADGIRQFVLCNKNGMSIKIANIGAAITAINAPDKKGNFADVALGFRDLKDYKKPGPYFGCVPGRFANRIAKGRFSLEGKNYQLDVNNGANHLHGGIAGFDKALWEVKSHTDNSITLTHFSPDGDQGYPGNLQVSVTYTLNDNNEIHIAYEATCDKATPLNLTNHTYFNLQGEGTGTVEGHKIKINASRYAPVDDTQIPTGIAPVDDTPFDLRAGAQIGKRLAFRQNPQLHIGNGYDHNFVVDGEAGTLRQAAHLEEPESGRVLDVFTTEPGVQLYTGNSLDGSISSKTGTVPYVRHSGFCLETQHYPDSPNHPEFPSAILEPGKTYTSETVFKFSVQQGAAR